MDTNLTKIIVTTSPSLNNIETIKSFLKQGISIFRINFSHGNPEEHESLIKNLRQAGEELNQVVTICLDTKGHEFRIHLNDSSELNVQKDDIITFSNKYQTHTIHIPIDDFSSLKTGSKFYVDDGFLALEIIELGVRHIKGKALNSHRLKNNKKANFPGIAFRNEKVDSENKKDIEFGIKHGVDVIFASFINSADCVKMLKEVSGNIPFYSKIETINAVQNIDEIINCSDVIMVARGDLGVETGFVDMFGAQKLISKKCLEKNKPVICATQMLESMTNNSIPLRSEISDIGNAVLDEYDAVMLSGETALGDFPLLCTDYMKRIVKNAEDYAEENKKSGGCPFIGNKRREACIITESSDINLIICLHKMKLGILIYVLSTDKKFLSAINLYRGIIPIYKSGDIIAISNKLKKDCGFKKVFNVTYKENCIKSINIL